MKKLLPLFLIGGGAAVSAAAWYGFKKSSDMEGDLAKAISGEATPAGGIFQARLTGYYPFQKGLTAAQRKMEGAPVDRKGNPLHTLEDYLDGKAEYVSLAGDYTIFPYGQKVVLNWNGKKIVGRVTDTGGHFHGTNKLYRVMGHEPLDVCVQSSETKVPKLVDAQIVAGDNFDKGRAVATAGMRGQTVVVGGYSIRDIVERAVEAAPIRRRSKS